MRITSAKAGFSEASSALNFIVCILGFVTVTLKVFVSLSPGSILSTVKRIFSASPSSLSFISSPFVPITLFADEGIGYLDNFVFASYSYSTVDFSHEIIDGIKIERVMLPVPNTVDEIAQAEMLADVLSRYGTCLEFYDKIEYISFGDYQYRLFDKVDYTYGKYPENVFEIVYNDERITYVSVCDYSYLSPSAKALMFNSDNLIIGSVGNTNYYLFEMHLPEIENIFYFDEGRITDKASTYYKEKGASMHCIKTPLILYD